MTPQLPGTACLPSRPVVMAEPMLVDACGSLLEAVALCIQLSRLTQDYVADQLGLDPGNFSRMLKGRANLPLKKMNKLMELCGNYAPLQWLASSNGFALAHPAQFAAQDRHARRVA